MFKSPLLHFSDIPCPCFESCSVPNCLFQHPNAQRHDDTSKLAGTKASSDLSAPPLKRLRLDDGSTSKVTLSRGRPAVDKARAETATTNIDQRGPRSQGSGTGAISKAPPQGKESKKLSPPPVQRSKHVSVKVATKESLNPRPVAGGSAPHQTRYLLLKMIYTEMQRLNNEVKQDANLKDKGPFLSDQELVTCALDEEERVLKDNPLVYLNKMKLRVAAYKKMKCEDWDHQRKQAFEGRHPSTMSVKQLERSDSGTGLPRAASYRILQRLVVDQGPLSQYGYVTSLPTENDILKAERAVELMHGYEQCERCKARFQVFPNRREEDGVAATGGSCYYHPGRAIFFKAEPGMQTGEQGGSKRYTCCNRDIGNPETCAECSCHVFKASNPGRLSSVMRFEETPENTNVPSDRAVCFDCEMGYTTLGLELLRVTAIDWPTGHTLLDILVKPLGTVLDLNTRFSGITRQQFTDVTICDEHATAEQMAQIQDSSGKFRRVESPLIARSLFFKLISPETPLMGHAIENDLNAIRVVHPNIVDTVILFPHRAGLPYRHGLQRLAQNVLHRQIQAGPGHDSKEDAIATADLVSFKVAKEWANMRAAGWVLSNGHLEQRTGPTSPSVDSAGLEAKRKREALIE